MNKKIVCIGGGHGLSNILASFKDEDNVTAIVSCANSGGSTGKLRKAFKSPAMGDVRRCLSAVSNTNIFEIRTNTNDAIGNLIIGGLTKLYNFRIAIDESHKLLKISNNKRIIPISLDNYDIQGEYVDGIDFMISESEFNEIKNIETIWLYPNEPDLNPEAIEAIKKCDYIILAPGSFYTSVIVNLLFKELQEILKCKPVIWIANLMQEKYETLNYSLLDEYNELKKYVNIDTIIINNRVPTTGMLSKYDDYLQPLTILNLKNINIISKPLLVCKNGVLQHSKKEIYKALLEVIK